MPGLNDIISQVIGEFSQGITFEDPVRTAATRVLGRMQQHLFGRWAAASLTRISCSVRTRTAGGFAVCKSTMAGTCVACLSPVCLAHGAVMIDSGELICFGCIEGARQQRAGSAQQVNKEDDKKIHRKYMRWLKLKGEPTEQEIRAAFKREAAKVHPDRMQDEKQRAEAEARFKELGQARDWLIAHLPRRAA